MYKIFSVHVNSLNLYLSYIFFHYPSYQPSENLLCLLYLQYVWVLFS
jgi:hypothetical protein